MPLLPRAALEAEHVLDPCSRASEYSASELKPLSAWRPARLRPFAAWLRVTSAMELRSRRLTFATLLALALLPCLLLLLADALLEPAHTPSHSECSRLCAEPVWQYWGTEPEVAGNASAVARSTPCEQGFGTHGVRLVAAPCGPWLGVPHAHVAHIHATAMRARARRVYVGWRCVCARARVVCVCVVCSV